MLKLFRTLCIACALGPLLAWAAEMVDINTASAAQLEQVKGIGAAKANAIVAYREENGPFASVDDLVKVPGIGEKSLDAMRSELSVSKGKTTASK